ITHKSAGTAVSPEVSGTHHYWSFNWSAPADFNGEATVYAAAMLTNSNGMNNGDTQVTDNYPFNVGLDLETINAFDFSVFPNPASAQLNINLKSIPGENTSISLCDAKGAFTTLISGNLTQKSYAFSLPQYLAKGMYTLTISSPKGQTSKKVLLN
ncbi:MAG: T9SS type A sorting domain-containing protein, partial [Flavobacteriales bacterium]